MKPSRRDALVALAGLPALVALGGAAARCGKKPARGLAFEGEIVGGSSALGHRLRTGELLARPVVRRERVSTAILGAGVSGLSAAWTLSRAGDDDFKLFELESEAGGNARSGRNAASQYPWGAHYVPVPVAPNRALETLLEQAGALVGRRPDGRPQWSETALCAEPQERLFFRGTWSEGLFPRAAASADELAQLARFEQQMRRFAAGRDETGRRLFTLPSRLSSVDPSVTGLDRISMHDWLLKNQFTAPHLRWFVEYGCRDDFGSSLKQTSAWAGIHYFAARLPGTAAREGIGEAGTHDDPDEPAPFLTWPEGNARLVSELARAAAGRIVANALVFDIEPREEGRRVLTLRYLDAARDEVVAVEAEAVVFALPKFMARGLIASWREAPPKFLEAFEYVPWLVANLTLTGRPLERGYPLSWDNVIYDSSSLGYVVATHQGGADRGPTVLTYYRPFAGEDARAARRKLESATWSEMALAALADLSTAHRDLPGLVSRIDVYRWGHAMARPAPGFFLSADRVAAGRSFRGVHFAHTDLSGLPLFEEAQDSGVRAAEAILTERARPFTSLLQT
ncbi:MAG: NAD(P)-binding protein [Thermoanaerobaculia bacterium]